MFNTESLLLKLRERGFKRLMAVGANVPAVSRAKPARFDGQCRITLNPSPPIADAAAGAMVFAW